MSKIEKYRQLLGEALALTSQNSGQKFSNHEAMKSKEFFSVICHLIKEEKYREHQSNI